MADNTATAIKPLWEKLIQAVRKDVVPATGCTEPIALALAAAIAAKRLNKKVERIEARVSGNMMKNGMGVIVPGTGVPGLYIAAAVGAIGGDPDGKLLVLDKLTQEQVEAAKKMIAEGHVSVDIAETPHVLYAEATVINGTDSAYVAIADSHTNVIRIEQNGAVIYAADPEANGTDGYDPASFDDVKARDVYEFATQVPLDKIKFILQADELNSALAEEGMNGRYGLRIGNILKRQCQGGMMADCLMTRVVELTTAASDARMGGAAIPAMTNSGSGNQGIAATVPVSVVAEYVKADEETLARALMLSHTMAIYIHSKLPKLSGLCAVTTASMGAAAGMAWLLRKDFDMVGMSICSMVGDVAGLICDGASNSCAMKVSTSVAAACKAVMMALAGTRVTGHEGIVAEDVDASIENIGELACKGMALTDQQILHIMLNKEHVAQTC